MCTYFGTIGFIIILWTSICLQDGQAIRKPFEVVKKCPFNESEWKVRAAHTACNGSDSYHCLLTEGGVILREQCTETSLFTKGFCPIFTNEGYLQWSPCKDTACPKTSYRSDEVFEYQICYQKTDKSKGESTEQGSNDNSSVTGVTIIIIIVAILFGFVLVSVSVLVVFYKRNQFGFKDKVQQLISNLRHRFQHSERTENYPVSDLRHRFQHSERTENYPVSDAEKNENEALLQTVDLGNGTNADQPVYAKPDKNKTKKEQTDAAKPGKSKTKTEKVANTTDTDDKEERGHRDKHGWTELNVKKLRELLKYLVHILKGELGVNDLQEKTVIHSKSIEEHFTAEPLRKELHSVKDLNDYDRLDMSLVFALLRNFCEKIKAPMRGWDYKPPDEEKTVGADIERIRFMWNKYCDNDLQFKHLDDVYNRMKQKFGTLPVYGGDGYKKHKDEDDFELNKDKIQGVMLNPDCTVEEGIVITENITSALKILKSRNVVVLKGAIGCGKTHALKAIQNHFKSSWETKWEDTQTIKGEILQEKPTVLLYDNFFGRFGNSVFSQDEIDKTENVLKAVGGNIKVVIGIHTHVYDEVKKFFKLDFLSQKNITVEMDKLTDAETLLIFKEQHRMGHCKVNAECFFRSVGIQSVLDMLSKNQGQIGGPFLSLMYCNQHELFFDEAFSDNPVQTLVQHFLKVKEKSPILFKCLVYLMCVQRHNCQEEPMKWIREKSEDITKEIEKNFRTSGYVYVEANTATLAHDILTIALFKSAAKADEYLVRVVENFEVDIMLQLLRPPGTAHNNLYCDFMDVDDKENSNQRRIVQIFVFRYASKYQDIEMVHPLFKIKFVKEKYHTYLKGPPKHIKK